MTTQKEHLEALFPDYQAAVEALQENNPEKALERLHSLGRRVQSLDLRLINDELSTRISEGSSRAVGMMAARHAPSTLKNETAANSTHGVRVGFDMVRDLFESIQFYESSDHIQNTTVLFYDCLALLTKMFTLATENETVVLKNLALRASASQKAPS